MNKEPTMLNMDKMAYQQRIFNETGRWPTYKETNKHLTAIYKSALIDKLQIMAK